MSPITSTNSWIWTISRVLLLLHFCKGYLESCESYDFKNFYNNDKHSIKVVFNAYDCKQCLQKLGSWKALLHRFHSAQYNLHFILLTDLPDNTTEFSELLIKAGDIQLISISPESKSYKAFSESSLLIFDSCSRLSYKFTAALYEVYNIVLKAAILSTWFDDVCGECEIPEDSNHLDDYESSSDENYLLVEPKHTLNAINFTEALVLEVLKNFSATLTTGSKIDSNENDSFNIPLNIILPLDHVHPTDDAEKFLKYRHIILHNSSKFHEHISSEIPEIMETTTYTFSKSKEAHLSNLVYYYVSKDNRKFEVIRSYILNDTSNKNNYDEIAEVYDYKVKVYSREASTKEHFNRLESWLSYKLRTK